MWLRRVFFGWLVPSAFVLPLWLFIGWGVFGADAWAFLWVLFLALPGILIWQLVLTLLIRLRGDVRAERAVTWADMGLVALWQALVVALGFFDSAWWAVTLVATIAVGLGVFWFEIARLLGGVRAVPVVLQTTGGVGYVPPTPEPQASTPRDPDVFVITENPASPSH